jgi:hypothetical protein
MLKELIARERKKAAAKGAKTRKQRYEKHFYEIA